jgi:hypothetical protein
MYVNGTRIKAKFFNTPDGAHGFSTWYDSALGVSCMPFPASDDVIRCMPIKQLYWADADDNAWYTTCSGDSNPVIALVPGTSITPYATYVDSLGRKLVRKVGAQLPAGTILYYGSWLMGCSVKGPPTAQYTFFSTGALLDPTAFAAMTESVE